MGLKYYAGMKDAPLSNLLIKVNMNTENQLMAFFDTIGSIVQELAEVQDHILSFIKVSQLTMAHMFQDQFLKKLQRVSTIQSALQELL